MDIITKPSLTLTQLPPEIICHIGDFLGIQKIALALTCKPYYQLLEKDVKKYKKRLKKNKKSHIQYVIDSRHRELFTLTIKSVDTVIYGFSNDEQEFIKKYLFNQIKCLPKCDYTLEDDEEFLSVWKFEPKDCKMIIPTLENFVETMKCKYCKSTILDTLIQLNGICSDSNFPKNSKGLEIILHYINKCLSSLSFTHLTYKTAKCNCVHIARIQDEDLDLSRIK
jgi:thiol-disulfide isomerase/thioredoxin